MNFFPASRLSQSMMLFVRLLLCQVSAVSRVCLGAFKSQIVHNTSRLSFVVEKSSALWTFMHKSFEKHLIQTLS